MGRWGKFFSLSHTERWALVEAGFWLGLSWAAIWTLPFRWIAPYLGRHMAQTPEAVDLGDDAAIHLVSWAVRTVDRQFPWDCRCLARAITAKLMLRRRDVEATLYLGVRKDTGQGLQAHAWLRSGEIIITGNVELDRFTVVSTFA